MTVTRIKMDVGDYLMDISYKRNLKIVSPKRKGDPFKMQFAIVEGDGTLKLGDTLWFEVDADIKLDELVKIVINAVGEEEHKRLLEKNVIEPEEEK